MDSETMTAETWSVFQQIIVPAYAQGICGFDQTPIAIEVDWPSFADHVEGSGRLTWALAQVRRALLDGEINVGASAASAELPAGISRLHLSVVAKPELERLSFQGEVLEIALYLGGSGGLLGSNEIAAWIFDQQNAPASTRPGLADADVPDVLRPWCEYRFAALHRAIEAEFESPIELAVDWPWLLTDSERRQVIDDTLADLIKAFAHFRGQGIARRKLLAPPPRLEIAISGKVVDDAGMRGDTLVLIVEDNPPWPPTWNDLVYVLKESFELADRPTEFTLEALEAESWRRSHGIDATGPLPAEVVIEHIAEFARDRGIGRALALTGLLEIHQVLKMEETEGRDCEWIADQLGAGELARTLYQVAVRWYGRGPETSRMEAEWVEQNVRRVEEKLAALPKAPVDSSASSLSKPDDATFSEEPEAALEPGRAIRLVADEKIVAFTQRLAKKLDHIPRVEIDWPSLLGASSNRSSSRPLDEWVWEDGLSPLADALLEMTSPRLENLEGWPYRVFVSASHAAASEVTIDPLGVQIKLGSPLDAAELRELLRASLPVAVHAESVPIAQDGDSNEDSRERPDAVASISSGLETKRFASDESATPTELDHFLTERFPQLQSDLEELCGLQCEFDSSGDWPLHDGLGEQLENFCFDVLFVTVADIHFSLLTLAALVDALATMPADYEPPMLVAQAKVTRDAAQAAKPKGIRFRAAPSLDISRQGEWLVVGCCLPAGDVSSELEANLDTFKQQLLEELCARR